MFWDAPWVLSRMFACWRSVSYVPFPLRSLNCELCEERKLVPIILELRSRSLRILAAVQSEIDCT